MADDLLNQKQLAQRWALSERTLERWRCTGLGPVYIKLGHSVRYRMADIEAFEQAGAKNRPINDDELLAKLPVVRQR